MQPCEHVSCYLVSRFCDANIVKACICRMEFYYECGRGWKTCVCTRWEGAHLLDRANVLVNRDANGPPPLGEIWARLVGRTRAHLVTNHECAHDIWRNRHAVTGAKSITKLSLSSSTSVSSAISWLAEFAGSIVFEPALRKGAAADGNGEARCHPVLLIMIDGFPACLYLFR